MTENPNANKELTEEWKYKDDVKMQGQNSLFYKIVDDVTGGGKNFMQMAEQFLKNIYKPINTTWSAV